MVKDNKGKKAIAIEINGNDNLTPIWVQGEIKCKCTKLWKSLVVPFSAFSMKTLRITHLLLNLTVITHTWLEIKYFIITASLICI